MCGVKGRRFSVLLKKKLNQLVYGSVCVFINLSKKAHLSDITARNIYMSYTRKMVAKTSWHRYGAKLRHCHPMYWILLLGIMICWFWWLITHIR